jgi:tetratricopeptide (TPR) repeat protein
MSVYLRMLGRGLPCNLLELLEVHPLPLPGQQHQKLLDQAQRGYPDVLYRLGLSHLGRQEFGLARKRLEQAIAAKPAFAEARLALAATLDLLAQPAPAAQQIDTVLSHWPESAQEAALSDVPPGTLSRYTLLCAAGFALERTGDWQAATARYQEALRHRPTSQFADYRLAAICLAHDRLDEAASFHQRILQQQPQELAVRVSLAHVLQLLGRHQEAVWEYEKACCLEPDNWELQVELAEELALVGHTDQAIEQLKELVLRQPQFPDLRLRLANLYSERGQDQLAVHEYSRALDLHPDYLDCHIAQARHELRMGRTQPAMEHFQAAIGINDQNVEAYAGLAVALRQLGRTQQAQETLASAARIAGNSDVLLAQLGALEVQAEAAQEAQAAFDPQEQATPGQDDSLHRHWVEQQAQRHQRILSQHPSWVDVRVRYGMLLKLLGHGPEARQQFEQAVAANPGYAQAWIQLGIVCQNMGDNRAATEALKSAVQLQPQWADLHYRLGLIYCGQMEFDLAVEQLEQLGGQSDFHRQLWTALEGMRMVNQHKAAPSSERVVPMDGSLAR